MASRKNDQNTFITLLLVIVLIAIIFLSYKVYQLNTLNTMNRNKISEQQDIVFESDNVNLVPSFFGGGRMNRNRWNFWPSNWSWNSSSELGDNSWSVNKYNGPGYQSGVGIRRFGNYCPYAGSCPLGGWKGCPYGEGCPGPQLPIEEVTEMPSLH